MRREGLTEMRSRAFSYLLTNPVSPAVSEMAVAANAAQKGTALAFFSLDAELLNELKMKIFFISWLGTYPTIVL